MTTCCKVDEVAVAGKGEFPSSGSDSLAGFHAWYIKDGLQEE